MSRRHKKPFKVLHGGRQKHFKKYYASRGGIRL